ncbi:MAG: hypothetical protein IT193_16645 [Propionibacteriaceae bacterium]|nr:hypothetical protein [Propionibacteriaceae bacterium]
MNNSNFKHKVEKSSLGSRQVTAARIWASKSSARAVLSASKSPSEGHKEPQRKEPS